MKEIPQRFVLDDRTTWASLDGRILDVKKRLLLRAHTSRRKIIRYSSETVPQKLEACDLDELRSIHQHASGGDIGSLAVRVEKSHMTSVVNDCTDPGSQLTITQGDHYFALDFSPFNTSRKIDEYVQSAILLGCIDVIQAIDFIRSVYGSAAGNAAFPHFVSGKTNPTFARFIINHLGFHPYAAEFVLGGETFAIEKEAINNLLGANGERVAQERNGKINIYTYAKSEDFFTDEMSARLVEGRNFLYRRMSNNRSDHLREGDIQNLEKRLRIQAIHACLKRMRVGDIRGLVK